ncbi:MAG: GlsB/YeaQ/YmgE family stress response membrane protein [candidate division KSB1 bacterium]
MDLLWTALIGLVVGVVAKFLMPGKDPGGFIITMALGIAGSFLATFLGQAVKWYSPGDAAGFIASVLGAMLLLWGYRRFQQKKA